VREAEIRERLAIEEKLRLVIKREGILGEAGELEAILDAGGGEGLVDELDSLVRP